jgi:hypothetical protein
MMRRVIASFGENMLPRARLLAHEIKGVEWLRQMPQTETDALKDAASPIAPRSSQIQTSLWLIPSHLIVTIGSALTLLALAFPPFIVPMSEGFVNNAGFAFILNPPAAGQLTAVVNTPLLSILVLGIVLVTAALCFLARSIEARHSAPQSP